jgi:hypothetical protein
MALRPAYLSMNVEFDAFLFAPVGEQSNGMPLTVMSALTRLDVDPWEKAAQLAGLTVKDAIPALASLIARLPAGRWQPAEAATIAARLVALLPRRAGTGPAREARRPAGAIAVPRFVWLICLALVAAGLFGILRGANSTRNDDSAAGAPAHVVAPAAVGE